MGISHDNHRHELHRHAHARASAAESKLGIHVKRPSRTRDEPAVLGDGIGFDGPRGLGAKITALREVMGRAGRSTPPYPRYGTTYPPWRIAKVGGNEPHEVSTTASGVAVGR